MGNTQKKIPKRNRGMTILAALAGLGIGGLGQRLHGETAIGTKALRKRVRRSLDWSKANHHQEKMRYKRQYLLAYAPQWLQIDPVTAAKWEKELESEFSIRRSREVLRRAALDPPDRSPISPKDERQIKLQAVRALTR